MFMRKSGKAPFRDDKTRSIPIRIILGRLTPVRRRVVLNARPYYKRRRSTFQENDKKRRKKNQKKRDVVFSVKSTQNFQSIEIDFPRSLFFAERRFFASNRRKIEP